MPNVIEKDLFFSSNFAFVIWTVTSKFTFFRLKLIQWQILQINSKKYSKTPNKQLDKK